MKRCRKLEHGEKARSCKGEDVQSEETAIGGKDSVMPVISFVFLQCLLQQSARAKGTQSLSNTRAHSHRAIVWWLLLMPANWQESLDSGTPQCGSLEQ